MRAYRIGDPHGRHPIYSGEGAALVEGRWHEKGQEVIYASAHYATAMLEKLAHYNGIMPPNQPDSPVARARGSAWLTEQRSAILIVPSYVAREELNVLINPHHPESAAIRVGREKPVRWDARLFDRPEA